MSLQVWLPLNGNVDNQGLSAHSLNGTPASWGTGKLGKCATFTGSTANVIYNNTKDFNYTDNFSVSLWINPNFSSAGSSTQYAFTVGRADYGGYGYAVVLDNALNVLVTFGNTTCRVDSCPSNEWHHIAFTVSNKVLTVYKDGVYHKKVTVTTLPTYSDGNGLGIGCFHYSGGNIYPFYGSLNDFRIYDHCLSAKEIKELSKGLCLHYKLAGIGGENILKNSYDTIGFSGSGTVTHNGFNGFSYRCLVYEDTSYRDCIGASAGTLETNTKYTLSFWAKGTYTIRCFLYPNACSSGVTSTGTKSTAVDGNITISLTDTWTHYWITWTTSSSVSGSKSLVVGRIQNQGAGAECYIAGVKFEKGDKATPWTPNPTDTLYSQLGLNSTTEYDCSGFGNHGTKVGTITASPNTVRHITSYKFPLGSYINCGTGAKVTDEITVNAWCYMDTWATSPHICSCTENGGFNFDATEKITFIIYVSNSYKYATSSKTYASLSSGWHMFTATYDGYNVKLYIDGVLDTTTPTGLAVKTPITYNSANAIFIHAEAGSNTSTPATNNYQPCNMSDFRIYATALSAEDIAQLYNTPASIDKAGNLFAYDCIEGENNTTSITKQGAVKSYGLLEDESAKIGVDSFTANALNEV